MKPLPFALAAGVTFLISFFLPAFAGENGFGCFLYCWNLIAQFPTDAPLKWLYYAAFVPTNLLFVAILVLTFSGRHLLKTRFFVSAALFFHVLSWLLVNLIKEEFAKNIEIQCGYYVWLVSFALLAVSQIIAVRLPAPPADSAP